MGDIAEAFEQHLKSLSDRDWDALVERVRPAPHQAQPHLDGEVEGSSQWGNTKRNEGLAEAKRRGFVDNDGKPITRSP